jgi:hypothetical protein
VVVVVVLLAFVWWGGRGGRGGEGVVLAAAPVTRVVHYHHVVCKPGGHALLVGGHALPAPCAFELGLLADLARELVDGVIRLLHRAGSGDHLSGGKGKRGSQRATAGGHTSSSSLQRVHSACGPAPMTNRLIMSRGCLREARA